ncbi:MAG: phosphonopyruvate decarboxylase [Bacteroidia bacterium]|nr:phosphonopyruvate decarboxylase [Bacteroidia bacterium]
MINTQKFYEILNQNEIDFYTGVPDSLLKDICSYISDNAPADKHIIAANEGGAVALAMGYYLATSKNPLVYMQNSGFGNTINPLLSLADPKVYSIPMLLVIGWRGEPGVKDEPQHVKQGEVSETLLKTLDIPYVIISDKTEDIVNVISRAIKKAEENNEPYAILVRKGTFEPYSLKTKIKTNFDLNREEAIIKTTELLSDSDIIVATTGKTSRELFEFRARNNQGHHRDFLTVGGMGHANQIALGISIAKPNKKVYCFDGDGAALMHTGSLGIIGDLKIENFKHIIFNNGAHDSVGGQPTIGFDIDFGKIAKSFNYTKVFRIEKLNHFDEIFMNFQKEKGPCLLEILVNKGARQDLGRPTVSPKENKLDFMSFIK